MNFRIWSLGRRITALCAIVATALAVIAVGAAAAGFSSRSDVDRVLNHIGPAGINSERLLSDLYREQGSVRTFALTALATDLAPYTDALQDELKVEATTRGLLRGEPALQAQLDSVVSAIGAYRTAVTERIIAGVRANGANPALATPTPESRAAFAVATNAIGALQQSLDRARADGAAQAQRTGNSLVLLLIVASVVVVVAGFLLAWLLRYLVTQPVIELAGEVRRVARGDYDHEITGGGPPELARLARDVNGMRDKIANDLAEVRAARKQVEEANLLLEQQTEELTRSNRDLEQFAYVASHDLQEPLRKVASFCQLLQRRYQGKLDDRADQYIAFAVDGAQRMQRLINDLLAFSRIGRLKTGFVDVDLNKVLADSAAQAEPVREETGAEIIIGDMPTVKGEEPLLSALFSNLINNALKFRHADRPPVIRVAATRVGDEYEITCQDNGIGIAPEFADKVFVIFQRLHAKEAYPGTGIGLAIAKKIVEYHGGRIWIDPEYTDGTLFRLTLPVPSVEEAPPAVLEETAA
jgi:signal transduction histidine kinase